MTDLRNFAPYEAAWKVRRTHFGHYPNGQTTIFLYHNGVSQIYSLVAQGSDNPVFRCSIPNDVVFSCEKCSHLLIENYIPQDYVGVHIRCFRCGHISMTPTDMNGEIFSTNVVSLGNNKGIFLRSTVETHPDLTITCDAAYEIALRAMQPREGLPFKLSCDGLDEVVALYERISPGSFALQERILDRTHDADPLKYPFAWAIRYFKRSFDTGILNIDSFESQTALYWIRIFLDAVGSWQHHPRFASVATRIATPDSFLHTIGQLLIAKHLFQNGNQIGLSLEDRVGRPNPDLYIRSARTGKIYLEVKAPRKLQSAIQPPDDLGLVEGVLKRTIDRSKAQINKNNKGVLIIISSLREQSTPNPLHILTKNWLNQHGRNRKSLACITIASALGTQIFRDSERIYQPSGLTIFPVLNPHFEGEKFININPDYKIT